MRAIPINGYRSIAACARAKGARKGTLEKRLRNGWSIDRALTAPVKPQAPKYIEYKGRRQRLGEWARELGIKRATISRRLRKGWSIERALGTAVGDGLLMQMVVYKDKTQPVSAWAKEIGIHYNAMLQRLEKWPIKDALTTRPFEPRRKRTRGVVDNIPRGCGDRPGALAR